MEIQKGNPYTATITITDANGDAYDLTGKTVLFAVKKFSDHLTDDSEALITKDITVHTTPTSGITTLELTSTDTAVHTGKYKADFRIYEAGVDQINTDTIVCHIVDIVTKRT